MNTIIFENFFGLKINNNKKIPNNDFFGVFVSIKRNHKLKNYPVDIHGCIGYMNSQFTKLTKKELYDHCLDVSVSALSKDSRKNYFPTPLLTDSNSMIEISWMKLPIIHSQNNMNHTDYGLIVKKNNNLTTYLPNVFHGKKIGEIKKDLLRKASLTNNKDIEYYCYTIMNQSKTLYQCLYNHLQHTYLKDVEMNINEYYSSHSSIFYNYMNGKYQIEQSQFIRNLASIKTLYSLQLSDKTKEKMQNEVKYILNLNSNSSLSFQESIALFDIFHFLKINLKDTLFNKIITNPISQLNKITDISFTLGQYGILCSKICNKKLHQEIYNKISKKYSNSEIKSTNNSIIDIFKLNWKIQFQYSFFEYSKNDLLESIKQLKIYYNLNKNNFQNMETNYLAVLFEATCHLFYENKKDIDLQDILFNTLMYLFQNRLQNDIYFEFKNKECRLDITCHILNGIRLCF